MKMSDTTEIKFNDWAITRNSYFGKLSEHEVIDGLYLALTLNGQIVDWVRLETVIEEYLKGLQDSNEPQWVRIALRNLPAGAALGLREGDVQGLPMGEVL